MKVSSFSSQFSLDDVIVGARFFCRLPSFLRHPISLKEARTILEHRLENRETDFLAVARKLIYDYPESPYRKLLHLAGCQYGDLEKMVRKEGVEGSLRSLLDHGVYLTVEEFKGRRPVTRGSARFTMNPGWLRNSTSEMHVFASTSGSRGEGTPVLIDLAFIRDCAIDTFLALHGRGGADWVKAHWQVPGGGAIARLIEYGSFGSRPVRWFSQVETTAPGLHPRYRWSARVMRWSSILAGAPLPRAFYVALDAPLPIATWMEEVLRSGASPHLFTFTSSAVRLCQAAFKAGIDLTGAHFTVVGEPVTEARLAAIRRSGAHALPRYAIIECSTIGHGCFEPETPDDIHFLHDLHALIQPDRNGQVNGLPGSALFLSSLRLTAPYVLLNVCMGDQAVITRRACACPLERLGWTTHLHTIRSYEKLTAGGMTFLDTDVIRILETVIPARFGGGPTDYQLLEQEDEDGRPRLRLLAHPALGSIDEEALREAFLSELGRGAGSERIMALLWRDAKVLRVERRPPFTTATGKILHLFQGRSPQSEA